MPVSQPFLRDSVGPDSRRGCSPQIKPGFHNAILVFRPGDHCLCPSQRRSQCHRRIGSGDQNNHRRFVDFPVIKNSAIPCHFRIRLSSHRKFGSGDDQPSAILTTVMAFKLLEQIRFGMAKQRDNLGLNRAPNKADVAILADVVQFDVVLSKTRLQSICWKRIRYYLNFWTNGDHTITGAGHTLDGRKWDGVQIAAARFENRTEALAKMHEIGRFCLVRMNQSQFRHDGDRA